MEYFQYNHINVGSHTPEAEWLGVQVLIDLGREDHGEP